jgi:ATPase
LSLRLVPDTSAIIDGKVSAALESASEDSTEVVIPYAVLDELQAQASKGREPGYIGLGELKRVREVCEKRSFKMSFSGERPELDDIRLARSGRIDALIIDVARKEGGKLLTADYVQALVAEAQGVRVEYVASRAKTTGLLFENFFTPETASIHLKQGTTPLAKRGKPGEFKLVEIRPEPLTETEVEQVIKEVTEATRISEEGFVEIVRSGATVLQLGRYRIAITRPPFSDALEVTIVRPIVTLTLKDYHLSENLMERLRSKAEGILVAGPPGSGKTTFASSLADFYMGLGKIVKTFESPRDMQVAPQVTQYGPLEGDFEKTAEILLLVRPDYTVYDEVRKTRDFQIFADMRLAGVGMIGVVHASESVGAIQRFIGRVELGMIPHIIDTIIFVKYGEIKKILELSLVVKVPTGMTEADLARPVVEVTEFESKRLMYEIYTFGEENVIIPIKEQPTVSGARKLAIERIKDEIDKFDPEAEIELVSDNRVIVRVDNETIPVLIGKKGATVSKLEEKLGLRIDVEPLTPTAGGREVQFEIKEIGNQIEIAVDEQFTGEVANVYVGNQFLFSATIGKKARIRVTKKSDLGKDLLRALVGNRKIRVMV